MSWSKYAERYFTQEAHLWLITLLKHSKQEALGVPWHFLLPNWRGKKLFQIETTVYEYINRQLWRLRT